MQILLALALVAFTAPGPDGDVAFADLGTDFLKNRCKGASAEGMPIEKLRADTFVHGVLGVFELSYPTWVLAEKGRIEDLKSIATALVQVQSHWMAWFGKDDPAVVAHKADIDTLMVWIKTWKPVSASKLEAAPVKDLFVLFNATEAQGAASKSLTAFLLMPESLGVAPRNGEIVSLVFAPARRDFIEMLGYAGLIDASQQKTLWNDDATMWTGFWIGWNLVLALEYPPWEYDKEFKKGLSMNAFEATGMVQHTVQQTMLAFLWSCYGDNDGLYLNQAQAMQMAIEVCGELNALEGEGGRGTTGAQTQPYEKFVPGGNPNGGTLPPIPAAPMNSIKTNQWHEGLGRDYFAAPLRKGQKLAQKDISRIKPTSTDPEIVKDKSAHFSLMGSDPSRKYVVSAPFFGAYTKTKQYPPSEFIPDYREFFRAYKCAFFHWIAVHGDPGGEKGKDKPSAEVSAAKYSELMKKLASRDANLTFEALVQSIYGVPLSGKNGTTDSLEWRFVEWLAKGK